MVELDLQDKTDTAIHVTAVSFTGLSVFKKIGKNSYIILHICIGGVKRGGVMVHPRRRLIELISYRKKC